MKIMQEIFNCSSYQEYLYPTHVVLLHLLHFVFYGGVQFVLELERLHVIHVSIAVEQVPLQGRSRLFLCVTGRFGLVLIVTVAVVPRAAVRLPRTKAHPTEVRFAVLIFTNLQKSCTADEVVWANTDHVIATAVLFDGGIAFGAFLGVGGNPVRGLRVIVALLDPLFQQPALYWIVPVLAAGEAEVVVTPTMNRPGINITHL